MTMLSGNNSTPEKATEAAQKDAIASAKDEIAMTVQERLLNYYNNEYVKGNVTGEARTQSVVTDAADDAVNNAKKRNSQLSNSSVNKKEHTITLKTKSYTVTGTIDGNGGIKWGDWITSTGETEGTLTNAEKAEKVNNAIGQDVNYSGYSSSYNKGWRVFYASESEMFLIAADIVGSQQLEGRASDTKSKDVFDPKDAATDSDYTYSNVTYGADYNEKWKTKLGETINTNDNSKATAYLCDPKNWTEYISMSAPEGTYAVGGPTKELLALSWETAGYDAKWSDNIDDDVTTAGYKVDKPEGLYDDGNGGKPIQTSILTGLYNTGTSYWLASPCSDNTNSMCFMDYYGYVNKMYGYGYSSYCGVRPIVSIPISNVQIEKDGTVMLH